MNMQTIIVAGRDTLLIVSGTSVYAVKCTVHSIIICTTCLTLMIANSMDVGMFHGIVSSINCPLD